MKFEDQLSKIGISSLLKFLNPRTKDLLDYYGILEKATAKKIARIVISSFGSEKIIKKQKIKRKYN